MPPKRDDYSGTELQRQRNNRQGYSTATDAAMSGLLEKARAKRAKGKYAPKGLPPAEPTPTTQQSAPPAPPISPKGKK